MIVGMEQSPAEYLISVLDDAVREQIITREQRDAILRRQDIGF
jgi:hypothetical protein